MRLRVRVATGDTFEWSAPALPFRVGRGDGCTLRFQGDAAATVSWEHAECCLGSDGAAYITDLRSSNGTYLDGRRIDATTAWPIGSTVQLGRSGPCLELLDAAPVSTLPATGPIAPARTVTSPPLDPPPGVADGQAPWLLRHAGGIGGGIVIAFLALLLVSQTLSRPGPARQQETAKAAERTDPGASAIEPTGTAKEPAPETELATSLAGGAAGAKPGDVPVFEKPGAAAATGSAKQREQASFRLLVIEDPKTKAAWPFYGAVIVAERKLLTTATVGVELAKFVHRGWKIDSQDSAGQRIAISDIRVHAAYQREKPEQQLYFDLAVLSTTEPLGKPVEMASAAELSQLERGQTLTCLAVDHHADPIDRFQQLAPQWYSGKIFALTSLAPGQAGSPRLVHLRGTFADKACGSPMFDDRGHLVALYCEPAPPEGGSPLQIHYAKVIEPELIELALGPGDESVWAKVVLEDTAPREEKKP